MATRGRQWAIAIHGGAGAISRQTAREPYNAALKDAMDRAESVLQTGVHGAAWDACGLAAPTRALAAALAGVEAMEDCELFNAGRGATLTDAGTVEAEASVMCGASMRTGAVCGLHTVQNPARLATAVFAHSLAGARFQFLAFASAERFADEHDALIARRSNAWFITPRRVRALEKARARRQVTLDHDGGTQTAAEGGTVGAAVCDGHGNVAVVTSTGGQTFKKAGRVGDTPVIGAGSYACNATLALSGTGNGEHFLRQSASALVSCAMRYGGASARDALHGVVRDDLPHGTGGFVAVTPQGEALSAFNSPGMFRALRDWQGKDVVRIWED